MKWIFYFLFIVNLGLAFGLLNSGQQPPAFVKSQIEDVGDLKIVSDVELRVRRDFQRDSEENKKNEVSLMDEHSVPTIKSDLNVTDRQIGVETLCQQIGPFLTKSDAENVADGLITYRLVAKIKIETDVKIVGYWAVIPSLPTLKESNQLVKKLKANGLDDVRRFQLGDMENAISLGLFSTKLNAIKRSRTIEKMGFVSIIKPKVNEVDRYWLAFQQPSDFSFPMKELLMSYPDLQIKTCSGIASASSIP